MNVPGEHPAVVLEALARGAPRIAHHVLLGELGKGGMGVVHRAYDLSLRRFVAIKVLTDPTGSARFATEARATARLRHPGIVPVFDVGVTGGTRGEPPRGGVRGADGSGSPQIEPTGRPYLVMELVDGESLESLLGRTRVAPERIAALVREVALALDHAHQQGVVHRDVKPENVLVDRAGHARLTDFGLARDLAALDRMTQTGAVLGTPAYMAPEQAGGETARQGACSDIYALGGMLYRALAGRPPFKATTNAALLRAILFDEPVPPTKIVPGAPRDLETIALRCLAKEPERRYATAEAVAAELARFVAGEPIEARPLGTVERFALSVRRNRRLAVGLAAATLVVGAIGAAAVVAVRSAQRRAQLDALAKIGQEKLSKEETGSAVESYDAALAIDPRLTWALVGRAKAKRLQGDVAGALADIERALALETTFEGLYWRGIIHAAREETKAALADFDAAIRMKPTDVDALSNRSRVRARTGDTKGGLADAEAAVSLAPDSGVAWETRGVAKFWAKDFAGAVRDLTHASELGRRDVELGSFRARARIELEDWDGALSDATSVLRVRPDDEWALSSRGFALERTGDFEGAIAAYAKAAKHAPRTAAPWLGLGRAYSGRGEPAKALEAFDRAAALEPNNAIVYANRAAARLAGGEVEGSLADFDRAIALDPKAAKAWAGRAGAKQRLQRTPEALDDYAAALRLDPSSAEAWANRGVSRRLAGDLEGSRQDLARATELRPKYAFAWNNLGVTLVRLDRRGEALEAYTRALEAAPREPDAWMNRGGCKRVMGDIEGARADLEHALELHPSPKQADLIRALLQQLGR